MAQDLKVLATKPSVLSLIPRTHMIRGRTHYINISKQSNISVYRTTFIHTTVTISVSSIIQIQNGPTPEEVVKEEDLGSKASIFKALC